ncbi:MAG: hypothetical protein HKP41_18240 [Desulfobacterales bacterium]|nr:hypothetical protein [Desulfobacterales bacterium]
MNSEPKHVGIGISAQLLHKTSSAEQLASLAGISIFLMISTAIVAGLWQAFPTWPSGLFAWIAAMLLVSRVSVAQILQIGALLLTGVVALFSALAIGANPPWLRLLDSYAGLLSMIAAVSFLKLVAMPKSARAENLPCGPIAFQRTLLAVLVLGSFINISAPILIGDRLAQKGGLSAFAAQSITRAFSGCSAWSPFFGGMAVVVTYIADTNLLFVMMVGLPFAILGLLVILLEARFCYQDRLVDFAGYPMTASSLKVPVVLAIFVSLGYQFLPQVSILIIIAMAALMVCLLMLPVSHGSDEAARRFCSHVLDGLPAMVGELLLFLAAGVLAVGLSTLVAATQIGLPIIGNFDAAAAGALLAAMVVISALGAHPIITIAVVTPLLAPINPDPQLLAVTYLFGWSLGTCASPLSGTHLVIQGRFGISSVKGALRNWPFVTVMYLVSLLFLMLVAKFQGI